MLLVILFLGADAVNICNTDITTGPELRVTQDIIAFYSSDSRLKTHIRTIDGAI